MKHWREGSVSRIAMAVDRLQSQRFELKFLIREEIVPALRQFVGCYLKPDEFAASRPDYSYPVHSLYLDSDELTTYQAVQSGEKNRFKLRIRYYSDSDKEVHFEVKRRTNEVISKLRATVRREAVEGILSGQPPQLRHLAQPNGKSIFALKEFCRLMHTLRATPRSHVAYKREAWMTPAGNSVRITMDRDVRCEPEFGWGLGTQFGEAVTPFDRSVVLELKFVDRFPGWCGDMIRAFGLVRSGAPKYAKGVDLLGEHRVSNRGVGLKIRRPASHLPARGPLGEQAVAVA